MPKKPNKTTARPAKASNNGPAAAAPRQRVARGTGEQRIVDAAIDFFAEQGFRASTRDLAKRLGVTQALLYRYFKSKQDLIDRVFAEVFVDQWNSDDSTKLLATDEPLRVRLATFYQAIAGRFSTQRIRLFIRAGLDDQKLAARYTLPLNERILTPIIAALRLEAGLPPPAKRKILRAERELALTLHGAIAHLGIRRHIYDSPLPDDLDDHVAFYVTSFLEGAIPTIKRLHAKPPRGTLGARLTVGGKSKIE